MIVPQARLKPASMAARDRLSCLQFFADALVDQTFASTAIPMVEHDTGDAGRVSVEPSSDSEAMIRTMFRDQRDVGEEAEQAIGHHHEGDDEDRGHDTGGDARLDRNMPRLGPTERSSATSSVVGGHRRSSTARSLAEADVKLPLICPCRR